ncbi:MAG TPA: DUF1579 domain-containing protein [Planctomycetota bacterium]|nr:DUF1579 domain-containing protein [Planctomycetota bacterium]
MKIGLILSAAALGVAAVAVAAMPLQDAKAKARDDKAAHAGDPMMEAMIKAGTPGAQHADLAKMVGTWKAKVKSYHEPGKDPVESDGTSTYEMALDGRYLIEKFSGEMPGMGPFKGMGILAYNNITGEFEHVWLDSMSTGIFMSKGKPNADGSCTFKGEMDNPMGGKWPCRMECKQVSDNERTFEMYCAMNGPETKSMEITYTR